jgi:hypothetical protein
MTSASEHTLCLIPLDMVQTRKLIAVEATDKAATAMSKWNSSLNKGELFDHLMMLKEKYSSCAAWIEN